VASCKPEDIARRKQTLMHYCDTGDAKNCLNYKLVFDNLNKMCESLKCPK